MTATTGHEPSLFDRLAVLAGFDPPSFHPRGCRGCGAVNVTTRQLAARVGISHNTVARLRHHGARLGMSSVQRIAARLGVTPAEVLAALWPPDGAP